MTGQSPLNFEYTALVGTPRRAYRVRNGREASTGEINAKCEVQNEGFKRAYYELLLSWTLIRTPYGRDAPTGMLGAKCELWNGRECEL